MKRKHKILNEYSPEYFVAKRVCIKCLFTIEYVVDLAHEISITKTSHT